MQNTEYDYDRYEEREEREAEALRLREREEEMNGEPVRAAAGRAGKTTEERRAA